MNINNKPLTVNTVLFPSFLATESLQNLAHAINIWRFSAVNIAKIIEKMYFYKIFAQNIN